MAGRAIICCSDKRCSRHNLFHLGAAAIATCDIFFPSEPAEKFERLAAALAPVFINRHFSALCQLFYISTHFFVKKIDNFSYGRYDIISPLPLIQARFMPSDIVWEKISESIEIFEK